MSHAAQNARAAFQEALEISDPAERERFVVKRCADDDDLAQRVRQLLAAHDEAGDFLQDEAPLNPEIEAELARLKPEEAGDRIGPYKLLELLGEGGFGTVWMAEQVEPMRRRVALKIIKMGMDTKEVIARFEQERQALAMMEHPNIAKVFDAGATQFGRPYFVMELVRGIPITKYCDQEKLPTIERLRLFIAVCHALQHAHHKGIIHRDLKPSNVLVALHDGAPVPKVIDFGVAKATQQRLTELTVFTQFEQMIGTPLYMSPEQAEMSGLDVDTRSDIYSLGVLLYELLTGRTPFDAEVLMRRGYEEIRRMIREQEPLKPSTALKTMARDAATDVAHHRRSEAPKLVGVLRGDLDWIVMKALEKDRSRRYETANGFAMDIERHLAGEPILARPPSTFYRLEKLVRRNKLAFAAAAGVTLALFAGAAFSIWQAREAERDASLASVALEDLQKTAPAFAAQAHAMAAREEFDGALAKLDTAAKLRPDVAEYRVLRGDILQSQLRLTDAAAEYRAAPEHPRAKANAALCDRLLAANSDPTKLAPESLRELAAAMDAERRPAAQRLAVARRLGDEKKVLLEYWAERLTDLPLPPERPIAERLTLRDDGLLALDLQGTQITDLAPLAGVPLGEINATGCEKLTDLAPASALPLVVLKLAKSGVTDLAPLAAMRSLKSLDLAQTKVRELAPLNGLALESLNLGGTHITDLAALKGAPLRTLDIDETKVTIFAPLAGMPLKEFHARGVKVADFSPLAGSPLETCIINRSKVADLGFLKGAPLRELNLCCCADARNYAALAGCKTLERLIVPPTVLNLSPDELDAITALRGLPALSKIEAGHFANADPTETVRPGSLGIQMNDLSDADVKRIGLPNARGASVMRVVAGAAAEKAGIKAGDVIREVNGLPIANSAELGERIRGAGANAAVVLGVWRDGAMQTIPATLGEVAVDDAATAPPPATAGKVQLANGQEMLSAPTAAEFWKQWDLLITVAKPLRAAGFTVKARVLDDGALYLNLIDQPIRDLAILAGAPVRQLDMQKTKVRDLSPLRTTKIHHLQMNGSPVEDLSPLRGLPLTFINVGGTPVKDLSPLEGMPLTGFYSDNATALTDLSPLAKIPTLTRVLLPLPQRGTPPLNIEPLRNLPELERLSFTFDEKMGPICTAKDFWEHWDGLGWMHALQDGKFKFTAEQLADGRWKVVLNDKRFSDCSIFKGAHVAHLDMRGSNVTDINPLRDIALDWLDLNNTPTADLGPLRGSALARSLKTLLLSETKVTDFAPVAECVNLGIFWASRTEIQDLGFLRGLKALWEVEITGTPVTDISVLTEMPGLEAIFLPWGARDVEKLRKLPKLRFLSYVYQGGNSQTPEQFWQMRKELPWVAELGAKGITAIVERRADGLWSVNLDNQPIADLAPLRGSRIWHLSISNTHVTDIEALRGMPLEQLAMESTKVTDLAPLAGMRLTYLNIYNSKITDISVLRGMPLTGILLFHGLPLDVAPLHETDTLQRITVTRGSKNLEGLRRLPRLERIGYGWDHKNNRINTSAAEFWAAYDREKKP